MKRSPLITVVIVLQLLLGLLLAGLTIYVLMQTRSRETLAEPDAAIRFADCWIGAAVLGRSGADHADRSVRPVEVTVLGMGVVFRNRCWSAGGAGLQHGRETGSRQPMRLRSLLVSSVPLVLLLLPGGEEVLLELGKCRVTRNLNF